MIFFHSSLSSSLIPGFSAKLYPSHSSGCCDLYHLSALVRSGVWRGLRGSFTA